MQKPEKYFMEREIEEIKVRKRSIESDRSVSQIKINISH